MPQIPKEKRKVACLEQKMPHQATPRNFVLSRRGSNHVGGPSLWFKPGENGKTMWHSTEVGVRPGPSDLKLSDLSTNPAFHHVVFLITDTLNQPTEHFGEL